MVLTWSAGTPLSIVAAAIKPADALAAIWRYDNEQGRFVSFVGTPSAPVDYTVTTSALEPVFLCMTAAGVLTRPAAAATAPPVAAPGVTFATLPPGARLPDESVCAGRVRRSAWEPRVGNVIANYTVPVAVALRPWTPTSGGVDRRADAFRLRITGNFTGTTDEIIQWAACKWGFDEDLVRAIVTQETRWNQNAQGDWTTDPTRCPPGSWTGTGCYQSYGIVQIKWYYAQDLWPTMRESTAFALDYKLASQRSCFEGYISWLSGRTPEPGYPTYRAEDLWGCVGQWFSGGWYTSDGIDYINKVKGYLAEKPWLRPGF